MFSAAEAIDGGFSDPVFDAQCVFRALMDAMARPGSILPVRSLAAPPAPLSAAAAAVALTLCDHDTPLWLDPALAASEAVRAYLAFHTGAPAVEKAEDAAFALVSDPALVSLEEFAQGTQEYPDRSTTLILRVDALWSDAGAAPHPYPLPVKDGERESPTLVPPSPRLRGEGKGEGQRRHPANSFTLQGPGIETRATLAAAPLPANFIAQWRDNRARFPRGVDLVLAAPDAIVCLPRTTRIREG